MGFISSINRNSNRDCIKEIPMPVCQYGHRESQFEFVGHLWIQALKMSPAWGSSWNRFSEHVVTLMYFLVMTNIAIEHGHLWLIMIYLSILSGMEIFHGYVILPDSKWYESHLLVDLTDLSRGDGQPSEGNCGQFSVRWIAAWLKVWKWDSLRIIV